MGGVVKGGVPESETWGIRETITLIDEHMDKEPNRSAFIEAAVRAYLELVTRRERDQADFRTINRLSAKLNKEASDVLTFQVETPA
jgi:metal-responsive CopG/Arc/MetJ family transcriptional regulator